MVNKNTTGNAVVVGGGVTGLCSAYYLAKDGWSVTVVDKNDFSDNCSYGNAGMIVPSHFTPLAAPGIVTQGLKWLLDSRSPFYVKPTLSLSTISWGLKFIQHANARHVSRSAPHILAMNNLSKDLYNALASEWQTPFGLERRGILMLYKTEKAAEEEIHLAGQAEKLGLDVEVLSRDGVQAIEPDVRLDVLGAVHYRCDGHLYPPAFMASLLTELKKMRVKLLPHAEMTGFARSQGKISTVSTLSGDLSADLVVLTGGAWLQDLAKKAGLNIPMMPGKGYSFMTGAFEGKVKHPALLVEARVALTPMGGKVRIGGTMELAPVNNGINRRRVEGIVNAVPNYYHGHQLPMPENQEIWHGFRPCSPDGLPYLGRTKSVSNLIVAGGMGMMGMSLGPATGKIVSEIAQGQNPSSPVDLFAPERFGRT